MECVDSKVFRSGNSEAVRLPKSMAFGADIDVSIYRAGDMRIIMPAKRQSLAEMATKLAAGPKVHSLEQRETPIAPDRDDL